MILAEITDSPYLIIKDLYEGGVALLILGILLTLIIVACLVLIIIANCKLFIKAGEKWWKGLIPFYSNWVQAKFTGLAWWWPVIFFVLSGLAAGGTSAYYSGELMYTTAVTNYAWSFGLTLVSFNFNYNLAKKFGRSNSFAFWTTVLPFVFLPILAFGASKYNKSAEVDENGVFSIKK